MESLSVSPNSDPPYRFQPFSWLYVAVFFHKEPGTVTAKGQNVYKHID